MLGIAERLAWTIAYVPHHTEVEQPRIAHQGGQLTIIGRNSRAAVSGG